MSKIDKQKTSFLQTPRGIFLSNYAASGGSERAFSDGFLMDFDIVWVLTFLFGKNVGILWIWTFFENKSVGFGLDHVFKQSRIKSKSKPISRHPKKREKRKNAFSSTPKLVDFNLEFPKGMGL